MCKRLGLRPLCWGHNKDVCLDEGEEEANCCGETKRIGTSMNDRGLFSGDFSGKAAEILSEGFNFNDIQHLSTHYFTLSSEHKPDIR